MSGVLQFFVIESSLNLLRLLITFSFTVCLSVGRTTEFVGSRSSR